MGDILLGDPTPQPDDLAKQEQKSVRIKFESKNLIEKASGRLIAGFIYVAGAIVIFALLIRVLHCFLPKDSGWMTPENISTVDQFLKYAASSTIGGFVMNRIIAKKDL
jgi:hypothetical protein